MIVPQYTRTLQSEERKETAAAHNRGLDLFVSFPAIDAAVRVDNLSEQFVYYGLRHADCFNAAVSTGSFRTRLPVAAKIALVTAGTIAEVPGSPMPPGGSELWMI